jgi:hypothetical protein
MYHIAHKVRNRPFHTTATSGGQGVQEPTKSVSYFSQSRRDLGVLPRGARCGSTYRCARRNAGREFKRAMDRL